MRDAALLGVACLLAILIGGWLFLMDANDAQAPVVGMVGVRVLAEGQNAGIDERKNYRIHSLDELQQLWDMTFTASGPAIPGVDFAKDEVLAVFDGSHSSGGYAVAVEAVEDTALSRVVSVVRTVPGDSCLTTSALTSPYQFVVVAKSDLPIQREERTVVSECE